MNITTVGVSILFAGIPLFVGAFFLVGYFGQQKASVGAAGLIAGIATTCIIAFFVGESRFSKGGDYALTVLWVAGTSLILGAISGFITRKNRGGNG